MEKGNKQAFKIGGKVVSKNRFDELVSSYLDMTITREELDLLAKLVSSNERAKNDFSKARRIHLATCKMFGKQTVKLPRLPVYTIKKRTRKRAAAEWSVVALLMFTTVVTFRFAQRAMDMEDEPVNSIEMASVPDISSFYDFTLENNFVAQGETCSLFRVIPRKRKGE